MQTGTGQDLQSGPKLFLYAVKRRITETQAEGKLLILDPVRTPEKWLHIPGSSLSFSAQLIEE